MFCLDKKEIENTKRIERGGRGWRMSAVYFHVDVIICERKTQHFLFREPAYTILSFSTNSLLVLRYQLFPMTLMTGEEQHRRPPSKAE